MIILSCSRAWATWGRPKLPDTRPLQCGNESKNETNGQICFVLFFCYSRLFTQPLFETSHRDRWERVSISRFRLDWRIRNREAIKSRRFLSSTLRYVAQKRWMILLVLFSGTFSPLFSVLWVNAYQMNNAVTANATKVEIKVNIFHIRRVLKGFFSPPNCAYWTVPSVDIVSNV